MAVAGSGFMDGVDAIAQVEEVGVAVVAAMQGVVARAAGQDVVMGIAADLQHVVTGTAVETVAARAAIKGVIAGTAVHLVDTRIAKHLVAAGTAVLHEPLLGDLRPGQRAAIGKLQALDQARAVHTRCRAGSVEHVLEDDLVGAIDVSEDQVSAYPLKLDVRLLDTFA